MSRVTTALRARRGDRTAGRAFGWLGAALGAQYGVGKIVMAARGELGVPGHPAPPSAYDGSIDVVTAQLANACLGLGAALLALALTLRFGRHLPRLPLAAGALVVLATQVGSLIVVGASLTGWREDHGQWGVDSLVLALVSVLTWGALLAGLRGGVGRPAPQED